MAINPVNTISILFLRNAYAPIWMINCEIKLTQWTVILVRSPVKDGAIIQRTANAISILSFYYYLIEDECNECGRLVVNNPLLTKFVVRTEKYWPSIIRVRPSSQGRCVKAKGQYFLERTTKKVSLWFYTNQHLLSNSFQKKICTDCAIFAWVLWP